MKKVSYTVLLDANKDIDEIRDKIADVPDVVFVSRANGNTCTVEAKTNNEASLKSAINAIPGAKVS